jgi:transposase
MSRFIAGADRHQAWMLPECLEDYVAAENPVRFIDAFVEGLEPSQMPSAFAPAPTGRPGYAPLDLLKLFLYGYLNRVRSSRELERLTHRNLEVIWLLKRLRPDHKTISEFRRAHRPVFKQVFRQFNILCRDLNLFGAEIVAIDGTFFKADNSRSRNFTKPKLKGLLKAVDGNIDRYLKEMALNDAASDSKGELGRAKVAQVGDLKDRIAGLQAAKARYEQMQKDLEVSGESQVSLTDPDARLLTKSAAKGSVVGYNVQSAVDGAHHLIVHIEATNHGNDLGQFTNMAVKAKEELQVETLIGVADGGYYYVDDLKTAEAQGIQVHVPQPEDRMEKKGFFARSQFRYDKEQDCYHCPGGAVLQRRPDVVKEGRVMEVYDHFAACRKCPVKEKCHTGRYRKIYHEENPEVMERVRGRMKAHPEVYERRKGLAEHPFGTLKFWWGYEALLTRGLKAVNAEVTLSALAYNMKRALKVVGAEAMLQWARLRAKAKVQAAAC